MNVFLDTSVIVSFLIKDVHTENAEKIFNSIFEGNLQGLVHDLVLVEVCGVISRKAGKERAIIVLKQLEEWLLQGTFERIEHNEEISKRACALAIDNTLKGADALIASAALYHNLRLATFDEELKSRLKQKIEFY